MKRSMLLAFVLLFVLTACQQQWVYEAERNQRAAAAGQIERVHYDVPPQVIYRIDEHRFFTLEDYNHCRGEAWYNDTKQGVRTLVSKDIWPLGFKGKLIIDDPTGMNVALPKVATNVCGDRGCMDYVAYSTDGGRSFQWAQYDINSISFDPVESSKRYKFIVLKDRLYVVQNDREGVDDYAYVTQYPLIEGINLSKPYPDGVRGDGFRISSRPETFSKIYTPSGQDHYVCDELIHDPKVKQ
ncbi:T6SS immunity protein Tli3 family protein [Paraburkholderia kururiensis]|uniref:T6SS immunity protein Tli3 family protein n=1 Tax=Paraburkholderia kururiensis TaxID=984307 RepID=UPI0012E08DF5|nr:lipoprotein [Paraburkholderia kururiensis]